MIENPVVEKRSVTSVRLLLAAGAALAVALASVMIYPYLVSFEVADPLLATVRAMAYACLVAVVALPITAIVRRLIR